MNELRDVELPELPEPIRTEESTAREWMSSFDYHGKDDDPKWGGLSQWGISSQLKMDLLGRERQLKSSLAANREQKAEIERLKQSEDEMLTERDFYYDLADKFSEAICELSGVYLGEHTNLNDPFQNALEVATSLRASKWVDVKWKLPKEREIVLIFTKHGGLQLSSWFCWFPEKGDPPLWHNVLPEFGDVTHWQPIVAPTLPGEEK
ncbi:hypothetical protein P8936_16420 [Edaphobacter paludis]|uniref:DUF551 domain-containing protein n=1 Tax=Edaphobacter paludis TaxID=3035702 RepID=A0AAU7D778_9BACT